MRIHVLIKKGLITTKKHSQRTHNKSRMQALKRMNTTTPLLATEALERAAKRRRAVDVQTVSTAFSSLEQMFQDIAPEEAEAFPAIAWEFEDDSSSSASQVSTESSSVSIEDVYSAGSKRPRSGLVRCKSFIFDLAGL